MSAGPDDGPDDGPGEAPGPDAAAKLAAPSAGAGGAASAVAGAPVAAGAPTLPAVPPRATGPRSPPAGATSMRMVVSLPRDGERRAGRLPEAGGDVGDDRRRGVALEPVLPLDDHLGGEDRPAAGGLGIGLLARGVARPGERVPPAEIVPVVDVEREGDHVVAPGEIGEERVRRRTGGAALAGVELEHHRARLRMREDRSEAGGGEQGCEKAHSFFRTAVRQR